MSSTASPRLDRALPPAEPHRPDGLAWERWALWAHGVAIVAALSCGGCRHTVASPPLAAEPAKVVLHAGDKAIPFDVELATTPEEHSRGLMNRASLPQGQGMLFIFSRPSHQTFWMKNTLIPLDMLFIGADHRVVGVVPSAEPLTLSERSVPGVSQFVLEINGGLCDRLGIGAGATVDFVHVPLP